MANKKFNQSEKVEPWFRLLTSLTGLKEKGGDGFIIEGRLQVIYNPIRNVNINISAPIFYEGEKIEIARGGYVGDGDKIYYQGNLIDKGLFFDTDVFYLDNEHINNLFRNFYFGNGKEKLERPFDKSEAVSRVRYNATDNCDSYFSVFQGLPEDYFLLPTIKEENWKIPNFVVSINDNKVRILERNDEKSRSLLDILLDHEKLEDFFEICNPQRLIEIERSEDIIKNLQ